MPRLAWVSAVLCAAAAKGSSANNGVEADGSTAEMDSFRSLTHRLLQGVQDMHPYAHLKASSEEACNELCNADPKCAAGDWSDIKDEKYEAHNQLCILMAYEHKPKPAYVPPPTPYVNGPAQAAEEAAYESNSIAARTPGYTSGGKTAKFEINGVSSIQKFGYGVLLVIAMWMLITGFMGCLRCCQLNDWSANFCFFCCPCICTEMCSDWANQWCTIPCPCSNRPGAGSCSGWNCSTDRWFCQRKPVRNPLKPKSEDKRNMDDKINSGEEDLEDMDVVTDARKMLAPGSPASPTQKKAAREALDRVGETTLAYATMSQCDRLCECIHPCVPVHPWVCRLKCISVCSTTFIFFGWLFYGASVEGLTTEPAHHRANTGFVLPDGDDGSLWVATTLASLPYAVEESNTRDEFLTTTNTVGGLGWYKDCFHVRRLTGSAYDEGYTHNCKWSKSKVSYKMNLVLASLVPTWHDFAVEHVVQDPENGNLALAGTVFKHGKKIRWMSFRGTANADNARTDLKGGTQGVDILFAPSYLQSVTVSKEFYESYGQLMGNGNVGQGKIDYNHLGPRGHEIMHKWLKDDPSAEVLIVGHSLGGAYATYGAVDAAHLGLPVTLFTYNSPRPGGKKLSNWVKEHIPNAVRLRTSKDVVSLLPPRSTGFAHVGRSVEIKIDIGKKAGLRTVEPKELVYYTWADDHLSGVFGHFLSGTSAEDALVAHSFWAIGVDASFNEVQASKHADTPALHAMGAFDVPTVAAVPFLNLVDYFPMESSYGIEIPGEADFKEFEEELEGGSQAYRSLRAIGDASVRKVGAGIQSMRGAFGAREQWGNGR